MKRYFSNVPKSSVGLHSIEQPIQTPNANTLSKNVELISNLDEIEINQDDIVSDPGLHKPIESFNVNIRDVLEENTHPKVLVNHTIIFFRRRSMEKIIEVLGMFGLRTIFGWNIV